MEPRRLRQGLVQGVLRLGPRRRPLRQALELFPPLALRQLGQHRPRRALRAHARAPLAAHRARHRAPARRVLQRLPLPPRLPARRALRPRESVPRRRQERARVGAPRERLRLRRKRRRPAERLLRRRGPPPRGVLRRPPAARVRPAGQLRVAVALRMARPQLRQARQEVDDRHPVQVRPRPVGGLPGLPHRLLPPPDDAVQGPGRSLSRPARRREGDVLVRLREGEPRRLRAGALPRRRRLPHHRGRRRHALRARHRAHRHSRQARGACGSTPSTAAPTTSTSSPGAAATSRTPGTASPRAYATPSGSPTRRAA